MDHVQLLDLLHFGLLQVSLRCDLGRCRRSFIAELLGDQLTFSVVCHDVLQLLNLGLQGHVGPLQVLDVLMLGLHRQNLVVEFVAGLVSVVGLGLNGNLR